MKIQTLIVLAFFALIVAGVSLGLRFNRSAAATESPKANLPGTFHPTKEQWASLKVETVQRITFRTERVAEGNIAYNENALTPVFSPYTGLVTRVIAKPGDVVKKGTPLIVVAAAEFVQAQSDLISARAQADLAAANEKRQHDLYLARSGALKDWLQSQSDLIAAENGLRSVRNRLHILGRSEEDIQALEKAPKGRDATNSESLVLSPISGTVIQRQIGVGQYISSVAGGAANPVYTIGDLSTVWLVANVREEDVPLMHIGQSVEVRALAYPERLYKARITWISPAVDPSTRRLQVRAEVENRDGKLKAMMFVNFKIIAGEGSASPGVPQSAIVYHGEDVRVYVARDDGTIVLRPVKLGRSREDGMVEVLAGLVAGENVITSGTIFIDRAATATIDAKR